MHILYAGSRTRRNRARSLDRARGQGISATAPSVVIVPPQRTQRTFNADAIVTLRFVTVRAHPTRRRTTVVVRKPVCPSSSSPSSPRGQSSVAPSIHPSIHPSIGPRIAITIVVVVVVSDRAFHRVIITSLFARTHLASSSYTPRAPSRRRMPTSRRRLVVGRTNEWLACARVRLYGITLAITRACVRGRWCASHGGLGVDCMGRGVSRGSGMSCACACACACACVLSRLRVGYVVCVR